MEPDRSDKFAYELGDVALSQCAFCIHFAPGPQSVCAAFPGQIPPEIMANNYDHRQPWIDPDADEPGDRGIALTESILFTPREHVPAGVLAALYRHLDGLPAAT